MSILHLDNIVLLRVDTFGAYAYLASFLPDASAVAMFPRKIAMSMGAFDISQAYTSTFTKGRSRKSAA